MSNSHLLFFRFSQWRSADAFSEGIAINSSGQVALHAVDGFDFNALSWLPPSSSSVLPVYPNNPHSYVVAINDAGDILGYDGQWGGWELYLDRQTPILWTAKGERVAIANCSRPCAMSVVALNNRGQIVGDIDGSTFRRSAAGEFETIPLTRYNAPRGMNDAGDVVGHSSTAGSWGSWLWTAGGEIIQLGLPTGAMAANAIAINNKGQVIGNFR